ncbi:MAG: hypothetical protein CVV21_10720 [Candidatus Goldiibacteriota bacterium HGW-Goldbacteria-1]|nr:MAG: hypothetical protein CVV21_10720 [Candidatus Goldiibacteriota bacterium HGW-Goldbacteria-1]
MRELHTGNLKSHIIHLSWPMITANVLQNLAAGFEMYLIGRINLEALAAFAIVMSSFYGLYLSLHGGLINAAITMTSRYTGRGNHAELNRAVAQMLIFAVLAFGLFSLAAYIFMDPMLVFFGAKGEVFTMAKEYTSIMLLSFLPFAVFSVFLGVLRGAGDSITPLKVVALMSVFWVILNPIFIFKLNLGLKGVALTALCTNTLMALVYGFVFVKGRHFFKLKAEYFKPDRILFKTYAQFSAKAILQGFVFDASSMLMLKLISGYGNAFIAAYGIVLRIGYFVMMIGWPIGNSGGVVVGHNLGAGYKDRAMQAVKDAAAVFSVFTIPAALVYFFFPEFVLGLFTSDPATLNYGRYFMKAIAFALPLMGAGLMAQSAFNAAGAIGFSLVLSFIVYWPVRIVMALILPMTAFKEYGIFWAMSLSLIFFAFIYLFYYGRKNWMNREF